MSISQKIQLYHVKLGDPCHYNLENKINHISIHLGEATGDRKWYIYNASNIRRDHTQA